MRSPKFKVGDPIKGIGELPNQSHRSVVGIGDSNYRIFYSDNKAYNNLSLYYIEKHFELDLDRMLKKEFNEDLNNLINNKE